jgi:hypothetical protein
MLVMLLAEMFPEDEGNGQQVVEWDTRREYQVSNLVVFIQVVLLISIFTNISSKLPHLAKPKKNG